MCASLALEVQAEGQEPGDFITEAERQSVACLRSHSQQVAEPGFEFQSSDGPGISRWVPQLPERDCWPASSVPKGED